MKEWRQGLLARGRSESDIVLMTNPYYSTLPPLTGHFLLPRMIPARYKSPNIARVPAVHPSPCYRGSSNNHPNRDPLRPHSRLHDLVK